MENEKMIQYKQTFTAQKDEKYHWCAEITGFAP